MARCSVYPRWRGEHRATGISNGQPCGLSPLARGTPPETGATIPTTRFIPAGAGNSFFPGIHFPDRAVYPRWRGELYPALNLEIKLLGLSPLARGTLFFQEFIFLIERFIPAGAGNSCCSGAPLTDSPVYPRWRGELINPPCAGFFVPGLSPLARGTLISFDDFIAEERFIPAGAGNSSHKR